MLDMSEDADWREKRAALAAARREYEPLLDSRPVQDAIDHLAMEFSRQRTNGQIYMNGSHNPLPTEITRARMFVETLLDRGWRPLGG